MQHNDAQYKQQTRKEEEIKVSVSKCVLEKCMRIQSGRSHFGEHLIGSPHVLDDKRQQQ